jgi:mycothiol synthase
VTKAPDPDEVRALAARIERRDGAPPLSDQALALLTSRGVAHFEVREAGALTGYAQLDGTSLEILADPDHLDDLFASVEQLAGDIEVWSHGRRSPVAEVAERRGYKRDRVLWQLRRTPGPVPPVELPDGVRLRTFVPGQDEQDWLEVNGAAFAGHSEQGRIGLSDLLAREHESWFDPAGFLLAVDSAALLGFHWTKVHPDGMGEVYVLGVSPAAQGTGLGRALLNAGLDHLGDREILLYVEESNTSARRLYAQAGFEEYDVDVQLRSQANSGVG